MKTRLTHVRINVSDINISLKWYCDVLGFETDGIGYPADKPKYYDFISAEGAVFAIMEVPGEKSYGRHNFEVGDEVDRLWERLKDKVTVIESIFDTPWGTRNSLLQTLMVMNWVFVNEYGIVLKENASKKQEIRICHFMRFVYTKPK